MVPSQTWHIPGCLCSSPSFTSAFWEKREGVCMTVWEGRTYKADSACEAASSFKPRVLSSQSLSTGQQQQHQDHKIYQPTTMQLSNFAALFALVTGVIGAQQKPQKPIYWVCHPESIAAACCLLLLPPAPPPPTRNITYTNPTDTLEL